MNELFQKYYDLRAAIDEKISKLELQHKINMQCKKGCDSCCESISIFPLEFDAIKNELIDEELPPLSFLKYTFTKSCRFLVNSTCQIYTSRPIICRTQGLPLLYENQNGNGYELSVCKLNFKGINVASFNMDNALFMPPFNSRLFLLNKEYVESLKTKKLANTHRFKLNKL